MELIIWFILGLIIGKLFMIYRTREKIMCGFIPISGIPLLLFSALKLYIHGYDKHARILLLTVLNSKWFWKMPKA